MSIPKTRTVEIAGKSIKLIAPTSFTVCQEIILLAGQNPTRAMAAALGVCWGGRGQRSGLSRREARKARRKAKRNAEKAVQAGRLVRPQIEYSAYDGKISQFGADFLDALMNQREDTGLTAAQVQAAGTVAFFLVRDQIVTEDDLEEAEDDFFEEGGEE